MRNVAPRFETTRFRLELRKIRKRLWMGILGNLIRVEARAIGRVQP